MRCAQNGRYFLFARARIKCTLKKTKLEENECHCRLWKLFAIYSPICPLSCTKISEHKNISFRRYCLDTCGVLAWNNQQYLSAFTFCSCPKTQEYFSSMLNPCNMITRIRSYLMSHISFIGTVTCRQLWPLFKMAPFHIVENECVWFLDLARVRHVFPLSSESTR